MLYPFKIRVMDPDLEAVLKLLAARRAVKLPDRTMAIKIGCKLKPIRQDIFMGFDRRGFGSFVSLSPEIDLEIIKENDRVFAIFKSTFSSVF